MAFPKTSPLLAFEKETTSSADHFAPPSADPFSAFFDPTSPSTTLSPMEMMTPRSSEDRQPSLLPPISEDPVIKTEAPALTSESPTLKSESPTASPDKRPNKKRKSWGQVLPEPKTNLPPRKRAKTEDEKEQRRVERVLRNRRAAQSSRERKRLEVEALERRNKELENLLISAQKANLMLAEELNRFRRDSGVVTRSSSPLDPLRDSPITLSQPLFGSSHESYQAASDPLPNLMDGLVAANANPTVDPASLSPELGPVPDSSRMTETRSGEAASGTPPDLTQRPAVMLCDLQCHSAGVATSCRPCLTTTPFPSAYARQLRTMLLSALAILSACQRPLMQIALSSKAGFSLLPTPQLLTTIIWLVTLPPASPIQPPTSSSTLTTSSTRKQATSQQSLWQRATTPLRTTASSPQSATLRFKSLRQILSSSPNLARPLYDATMEALRLVSERRDDRVTDRRAEPGESRHSDAQLVQSLRDIVLPSPEVLISLLWALKVEERRMMWKGEAGVAGADQRIPALSPKGFVLKLTASKRRACELERAVPKRHRPT